MALYRIISILLAGLALGCGILPWAAQTRATGLSRWLPRQRWLGLALGAGVLAWNAYEGAQMLPASYTPYVWGLVPIAAFLCFFWLDYTFSRAFGGLLALLANYGIQHCFAFDCAWRGLYAALALAWGLSGLALVAWPWLMRDALEPGGRARLRWWWLAWGCVSALGLALLPLFGGGALKSL